MRSSDGSLPAVSAGGSELRGHLPAGVRFASIEAREWKSTPGEPVTLRFAPDGWADPAVIRVVGQDGDVASLTIAGLAGRVETAINEE